MSRKRQSESIQPKVALCYIRQSYTRDDDDLNSPERQRANIEEAVKRKGWVAEWYEDVGGHKSGRKEENRPAWLKLKARLGDPDVAALIANDLSRLHRKGWRVGDLIDHLERYGVALVLAAPNREVDTSTPLGRMFIQFGAIVDEYYVHDIAQRAKDSILYRKKRGISVGKPPFGTLRGDSGYLEPSPEGAWLLPSGKFAAGAEDERPEEGAVWRSYYACAGRILTLYAQGNLGLEKIAYQITDEGWTFCDRWGNPRPITREDIRRVVANWPEYGGLVEDKSAKTRPAYESQEADEIRFVPERAVFDIELLRRVAQVRQQRTLRPVDAYVKRGAHPYPLSNLVYCAHCEQLAKEENNPRLRSRLSGHTDKRGTRRYKHKAGVQCGCHNRSVPCGEIEADFGRLLKLMTVDPEAIGYMTELAIQADLAGAPAQDEAELERQKQEAIALCRRRIDAAVNLYSDGYIDYDEFQYRVEENEREIAHWEARTTDTEKVALELAMCLDVIDRLAQLWDTADDEDRQGMAQSLFEEIVYNLDTRRIESYRLKPWAERFLCLRMALYAEEQGDLEPADDDADEDEEEGELAGKKEDSNGAQGGWNLMPHRGFEPTACFDIWLAAFHILERLYDTPFPAEPQNDLVPEKAERNAEIRARYEAGASVSELAAAFEISEQRISQIIHGRRN